MNRSDTEAFQDEVSEALQQFVRRARRLGEEIAWGSVGAAVAALSERDSAGRIIRGIDYIDGGFFPSGQNIQTAAGVKYIVGAPHAFHTCADAVSVGAKSAATANEINLTFVRESQ